MCCEESGGHATVGVDDNGQQDILWSLELRFQEANSI